MQNETTNTSTNEVKRGDLYCGGLYVGTTEAGVEWVSYKGAEDFARLCERFDARSPKPAPKKVARVRKLSERVADVCGDTLAAMAENGEDVSMVKVGATFAEGDAEFLASCAARLEMAADDVRSGMGCEAASCNEMDFRFAEMVDARTIKSLLAWAKKFDRAAANLDRLLGN